jgi:hypothetical protein
VVKLNLPVLLNSLSMPIEEPAPQRVFHHQHDCPNHQQYVENAFAELQHEPKHPDHDGVEEECPKHQRRSLEAFASVPAKCFAKMGMLPASCTARPAQARKIYTNSMRPASWQV